MAPSAAATAAAKKWASGLDDAQRKIAGELAVKVAKTGLSTGMFGDFKKIQIPMDMNRFLKMAQLSPKKSKWVQEQLVAMLKAASKG